MNLSPLASERPLIVYLDIKSPYAYLAWQPTARMARELGVLVDWRPFVLDIPSYLGSARLDERGKVVEQQRSAQQWSGVKYAYFDCRRYASLYGLTVRGTVKIWDTNLAAIGFLWAKGQGDRVLERYLELIYPPFWRRELDVEDPAVVERILAAAGADVAGFGRFAREDGQAANAALQAAAFDAGIFGVPTYVVAGRIYFGREHLPRIRWHLMGEVGPAPDIANPLPANLTADPADAASLTVCIDFKSPQSYLALASTLALAHERAIALDWQPIQAPPLKRPAPVGGVDDRGTRHRRHRAEYLAGDLARYAPHPLTDIHADFDSSMAAMGLLWLRERAPARLNDFVERTLLRFWRDGLPIDRVTDIEGLLTEAGTDPAGFAAYAAGRGPSALRGGAAALAARGVTGVPTYLLGDEPYLGRQHLPLIAARLAA